MSNSTRGLSPTQLDAAVELMGQVGLGGTVRVQGISMEPSLVEGQVLAVEFTSVEPTRGDLLLYRQVDYLVVHRLLGRARHPDGRPCLRTRGDGHHDLDPPLDRERVLGRVIAVQCGGIWRTLQGRGARRYAGCVAWHDLAWAAAGVLARRGDRALSRLGLPAPLWRCTAALDRGLLGLVHRLIFPRVHAVVPAPPGTGASGGPS